MADITAVVKAFNTLTSDGTIVTVNDTVTIGDRVYTFKAAPTTVAGEVKAVTSASVTLDNLKAAINLTGTPGTDYGSLTTINPYVTATTKTATTLKVEAKLPGVSGNAIHCLATSTHLDDWTQATCAGGSGSVNTAIGEILATQQVNAAVAQNLLELTSDY